MNHYTTSKGERVSQSQIDYRIRRAKEQKIEQFLYDNGYIFCESCGKSGGMVRIDCSHEKSVDWCKKNGCIELAWDVDNLRLLCRLCHQKHDKVQLFHDNQTTK